MNCEKKLALRLITNGTKYIINPGIILSPPSLEGECIHLYYNYRLKPINLKGN